MATVNTAFGVLPSPRTQTLGGNAGGGVGSPQQPRQPRQPQQPRAPQGQGLAPGAAPTFAQLQQQGQARPAPPMQPGVQPARPLQQPPMLARLGAQLAPRQATQAQAQPQGGQQAPQQSRVLDYNAADAAQRASGGPAATPWTTTNVRGDVTSTFTPAVPAEYEYYIPLGESAAVRNPAYAPPPPQQLSLEDVPADVMASINQAVAASGGGYAQGAGGGGGLPDFQFSQDAFGNLQVGIAGADGIAQYGAMPAAPAFGEALPFGGAEAFEGSQQAQDLRARLEEQLNILGQGPALIEGQSYEALRQAKIADLEAEFGAQKAQLEEELARRGLSASTFGGGRYGDVAGQQARALTGLEADLLRQQAEAEAKNRQMYLSGMTELAGISGAQDLAQFEANLKARQSAADINFRAQEIQQTERLKGRELDLQSARDIATAEAQRGQLSLGYAEMGSRERLTAQEIGSRERLSAQEIASREQMQRLGLTFEAGQSQLERDLREKLQTTQLTSEERRQLTQIEAERAAATQRQTFEAGQSQLERTLREKMQTTELTAQEKRQLAEIEANKAAQADRQKFEAEQAKQNQTWQAEQGKLDRDLRSLLSKNELDAAQARFEKTYALDLEKFGFEKGQASNQFLSQLATVLAPMDPKKRDEFLRTIGIKLPGTPAGSVGGTSTGGAYGTDTGI